jgi:hypothetical protein
MQVHLATHHNHSMELKESLKKPHRENSPIVQQFNLRTRKRLKNCSFNIVRKNLLDMKSNS